MKNGIHRIVGEMAAPLLPFLPILNGKGKIAMWTPLIVDETLRFAGRTDDSTVDDARDLYVTHALVRRARTQRGLKKNRVFIDSLGQEVTLKGPPCGYHAGILQVPPRVFSLFTPNINDAWADSLDEVNEEERARRQLQPAPPAMPPMHIREVDSGDDTIDEDDDPVAVPLPVHLALPPPAAPDAILPIGDRAVRLALLPPPVDEEIEVERIEERNDVIDVVDDEPVIIQPLIILNDEDEVVNPPQVVDGRVGGGMRDEQREPDGDHQVVRPNVPPEWMTAKDGEGNLLRRKGKWDDDTILLALGFPFNTAREEILSFFSPHHPIAIYAGFHSGKMSGSIMLSFPNSRIAGEAAKMGRDFMGRRINLFTRGKWPRMEKKRIFFPI